jgi:hypothetical protein
MAGPCGLGVGGVAADTARTNVQIQKAYNLYRPQQQVATLPQSPLGQRLSILSLSEK